MVNIYCSLKGTCHEHIVMEIEVICSRFDLHLNFKVTHKLASTSPHRGSWFYQGIPFVPTISLSLTEFAFGSINKSNRGILDTRSQLRSL